VVEPSQVRVVEPLAPFAVGFIEELERLGYRVASIVGQMKLVANLSRWMARECLGVEDLSPEVIASYVAWRREQGYRGFVSVRCGR
jgi:integrase/recombinase XerD